MLEQLKNQGFAVENAILTMEAGCDNQRIRKFCFQNKIKPNVKQDPSNRKKTKRDRKRFFDPEAYRVRFSSERTFAWMDAFRTLFIRFDTGAQNSKSSNLIAACFLYQKV
jgi:hypothetical protein